MAFIKPYDVTIDTHKGIVEGEFKWRQASDGVNQTVEVYVTLILKGQKTIEQVPAIIREQVQTQLDLLTK